MISKIIDILVERMWQTMKKIGKVGFDFEFLKNHYNFPADALLKNISVDNELGTIDITFYTNEDSATKIEDLTTIRREPLNKNN